MNIYINIDSTQFKSRASLVKAKQTKPSTDALKKAKEIIGYKQEGHYMVALTKDCSSTSD